MNFNYEDDRILCPFDFLYVPACPVGRCISMYLCAYVVNPEKTDFEL
jgi:hypothetical protein